LAEWIINQTKFCSAFRGHRKFTDVKMKEKVSSRGVITAGKNPGKAIKGNYMKK
jgi:hypothetical protein